MPLTHEILILAFILSGVDLKLADLYDRKRRGYIFATLSAIFMGFLISGSSYSSSIMLGIILGVTLAGKVDQPNLMMGLGLTLATAITVGLLYSGFIVPDLFLLALVTGTALIDEAGHDKITSGRILKVFFRFRMTLKITIILMTILTQTDIFHAIDIIDAIGFFCFDLSYDIVNVVSLSSKRCIQDSIGEG